MLIGTFTGTGTSRVMKVTLADLSISGTFSATVELQRKIGGNWVTVETITGPTELVVDPAGGQDFRLECTAYTSGTVTYAMG